MSDPAASAALNDNTNTSPRDPASLQVSPSDTAVESPSGLEHPNPFFEPDGDHPGSPQQDDDRDEVQSVKSDTAVSVGPTRTGSQMDANREEERLAIEHNARRIPPQRKVHWPSERTMQHQFHPTRGYSGTRAYGSSVSGTGGPSTSASSSGAGNPRIEEEERERREDSNRARRQARRLVSHNREHDSAWVVDDGSETALSSEGEEHDGRRPSSPFYAKNAHGHRGEASGQSRKEEESRRAWNERDVADQYMDPQARSRERQLRRRQGKEGGASRRRVQEETSEEGDSEPDTSDEEDGVDRISSGGLSGIFASMFGKDLKLSQGDDQDQAEKGETSRNRGKRDTVKQLGRESRDRIKKRRRWSHHALFRRDSMSSLRSGRSSVGSWSGIFGQRRGSHDSKDEKARGAGVLESEQDARDDAEDMHLATSEDPNDPRVQKTGRSEDTERENAGEAESPREELPEDDLFEPHMLTPARTGHSARSSLRSRGVNVETEQQRARRHMKEDLNSPYIPSGRMNKADAVAPNARLEAAQGWKTIVDNVMSFCRGNNEEVDHTGQYRSFAALIIATQGLAGVASPELARVAPASGKEAETNKGMRKLSEYSNPRDKYTDTVKEISDDMIHDAQEDGAKLTKNLRAKITQRAIKQADGQVGDKPMRGKRRQKEIRISRHPAELVQRQDFIVSLAKALIK